MGQLSDVITEAVISSLGGKLPELQDVKVEIEKISPIVTIKDHGRNKFKECTVEVKFKFDNPRIRIDNDKFADIMLNSMIGINVSNVNRYNYRVSREGGGAVIEVWSD